MAENTDKQSESKPAFDPRIQTEDIAFDPNELVGCTCGRMNPPNRLSCLYCGRELEITDDAATSIKTNLRKLESWERGFNVILRERSAEGVSNNEKAAMLLSMEPVDLTLILYAGCPLPLARVESEKEAEIIVNGLTPLGLKCSIVRDDDLSVDKPPVRLSTIEDREGSFALKDFNTGNVTEIAKDDLALIVTGILISGKVDSLEKKRRGKESKLLDETTTAADESVLDIYTLHDPNGFRVRSTGFDFSCLGEDKGLLAAENLRALMRFLKERSPNAKLVDNYSAVRQSLGSVWEVESRKDSKGLQRAGFGKTGFGTVASTNNLNQFTKYSRLQWHLL